MTGTVMTTEEERDKFFEQFLVGDYNHSAVREGLFMDSEQGQEKGGEQPRFRDVVKEATKLRRQVMETRVIPFDPKKDQYHAFEQEYLAGVRGDATGEGFICDMLTYALEEYDYKETQDLEDTLHEVELTVSNLMGCPRLQKGLCKALQQYDPEKVSGKEDFDKLLSDLEKNHDKWADKVAEVIAKDLNVPVQTITYSTALRAMEYNEQVLDRVREMDGCVELIITKMAEGDRPGDFEVALAIRE